eukprot:CAMPEP_0119009340 /NCGR_PEP_ID=MMETSP1176-20130426/4298_1 /TAXON_ID=265551 /ORGANISM="Synedropsis recta cf, Strain CCMP1620" /LENGTH=156 /DNA_ID=CAMNT_0006961837 /DNA_START=72 /DNA_END=542 /DNA_ORIENTATION=-
MGVYAMHIFDRKGKTLFTKRYAKASGAAAQGDDEQLSEQRKLVFGMLFSLREMVGSLAPSGDIKDAGLHSVRTGAGTLHNYETTSGLRFALYTTNISTSQNTSIRGALKHVYTDLWVECVIRSPLYVGSSQGNMNIASTNFEQKLDAYLSSMPWYK